MSRSDIFGEISPKMDRLGEPRHVGGVPPACRGRQGDRLDRKAILYFPYEVPSYGKSMIALRPATFYQNVVGHYVVKTIVLTVTACPLQGHVVARQGDHRSLKRSIYIMCCGTIIYKDRLRVPAMIEDRCRYPYAI